MSYHNGRKVNTVIKKCLFVLLPLDNRNFSSSELFAEN